MRKYATTVLTMMCLAVGGCVAVGLIRPEVHLTMTNRTSDLLGDVAVYFGRDRCSWGWVGRDGLAIYFDYRGEITAQAEVRWKDGEKEMRHTVDVKSVYDFATSGYLRFVIYDDRAVVEFSRDLPPVLPPGSAPPPPAHRTQSTGP